MRIKETKVYRYDELSDKAKEKAREWFTRDYDWWDYIIAKSDYNGADMYVGEALKHDAQFIVTACNAHEELVKIAQAYRNHLKVSAHTDGEVATYHHIEDVLNTIEKGTQHHE